MTAQNKINAPPSHNIDEKREMEKSIFLLITFKEWKTLEAYIKKIRSQSSNENRHFDCRFQCANCGGNHNVLHYACQYRKIPFSTILAIMRMFPNAIREKDCKGRLPLHCATRSGVGSEIIEHLLRKYPNSSVQQDDKGKTPLHLACKYFSLAYDHDHDHDHDFVRFEDDEDRADRLCQKLNSLLVMFMQANSQCFLIEDENDMSALEYTIEQEVSHETIYIMQKVMERMQKMKSAIASQNKKDLRTTSHGGGHLVATPGQNTTNNAAA